MRRVLACVDPDALDRAIGRWLATSHPPPPATIVICPAAADGRG